jgi:hypothetical protein
MTIEGQHNLSIIAEALGEHASTLESRVMNQRFYDETQKQLLLAKLRGARRLQSHIQAASLSEKVNKSLIIS